MICPDCKKPMATHAIYRNGHCPVVRFAGLRAWVATSSSVGAGALTSEILQDACDQGRWGRFWREAQEIRRL